MDSKKMKQLNQCIFITDHGFLRPTLLALWSLLRSTSKAPVIHFWGNNLTDSDWCEVERVMASSPDARLCRLDLGAAEMQNALGPEASKHVTAATMARLLIPSKLTGNVLYIDGDTLIVDDVSKVFETHMQGKMIGAVRDLVMMKRYIRGPRNSAETKMQMEATAKLIGKDCIGDYVNAGILLIDTDTIRSEPDVHVAMQDISTASTLPFADQDHLNHVFKNRIHYLNPAWNASWGRLGRQRHFTERNSGHASELKKQSAAILHFHGPNKPWKVPRRDFWTAKGRAVITYRMAMRKYLKAFPDLSF